ncbi:hypothetical protein SAMN05444266_11295 [Chitinophaga jiangningensis]|uniref:BZIP transcription factor n=1 Tax=Chitinophaga jiangningensis TaxID=1419482 RepID=A0A1M7M7Q3_9BACT|nr:hypothetical protein [Chitinophaga jiangningensis]SHM86290.1 hypothetical protein SAMN05444266_11295 [Chitinophaga jiangningensis]
MLQKVLSTCVVTCAMAVSAHAQAKFNLVNLENLRMDTAMVAPVPMGIQFTSATSPQQAAHQATGYVGLHRRNYMTKAFSGDDINDEVGIWIKGYYQGVGSSMPIFLGGNSYLSEDAKMMIAQDGKVGIGTTKPLSLLSVNGEITAQKVRVTGTGWADFVFAPDYALPSLQGLAAFIKEHQHLPEIPSAATVEKEGIELGEMNKKLLQKIEELTLYIIRQDQQLEEVQARLKKLEEKK